MILEDDESGGIINGVCEPLGVWDAARKRPGEVSILLVYGRESLLCRRMNNTAKVKAKKATAAHTPTAAFSPGLSSLANECGVASAVELSCVVESPVFAVCDEGVPAMGSKGTVVLGQLDPIVEELAVGEARLPGKTHGLLSSISKSQDTFVDGGPGSSKLK